MLRPSRHAILGLISMLLTCRLASSMERYDSSSNRYDHLTSSRFTSDTKLLVIQDNGGSLTISEMNTTTGSFKCWVGRGLDVWMQGSRSSLDVNSRKC
eukprot:755961-Hanusia_phi.AAC.10